MKKQYRVDYDKKRGQLHEAVFALRYCDYHTFVEGVIQALVLLLGKLVCLNTFIIMFIVN